MEITTFF